MGGPSFQLPGTVITALLLLGLGYSTVGQENDELETSLMSAITIKIAYCSKKVIDSSCWLYG
jgi:hypothetical protein